MNIKVFFSSSLFYIIAGIVLVLVITLSVLILVRRRKKMKKEMKTATMIDQMSMRRASIDTTYLEKDFFRIIERLIYSYYSQQPQLIPGESMTADSYMEWYNRLKREYELKIRKNLYDFKMVKARVIKQDNSSMYGVSKIEVEAEFKIDYFYSHVTLQQRVVREFRQVFVFLNMNNTWVLEEITPEEDLVKHVAE